MIKQYLNLPRAIHILCVGAFINRAGTFLVPFLTLYLQEDLELGIGFATRAMGAYGFGSIAAFLVGGHLADSMGRRTVMLISLFGAAAILLVFGSLRSPWAITLALVCFAMVAEMYRPAASAMIADLVPPDHRAHAFSLMYVSINLGAPGVGRQSTSYFHPAKSPAVFLMASVISGSLLGLIISIFTATAFFIS